MTPCDMFLLKTPLLPKGKGQTNHADACEKFVCPNLLLRDKITQVKNSYKIQMGPKTVNSSHQHQQHGWCDDLNEQSNVYWRGDASDQLSETKCRESDVEEHGTEIQVPIATEE